MRTLHELLTPYRVWRLNHPDPSIQELADRHADVLYAVALVRAAGRTPPMDWLLELGVAPLPRKVGR